MSNSEASPARTNSSIPLFLVLLGLFIRLISLGSAPLTDPSEGRYAVMGQNMYLSGDWLTPRVYQDGELIPFLGKPPLHAWTTATSYSIFGTSEFAARFPSFLASSLVVLLVFLLASQLFSVRSAGLSALLLLSSWLFFFLGNSCLTDPLLMLFVSLSMFAMGKILFGKNGEVQEVDWNRSPWTLLLFVFLSCGMMVKGPIAIALPGVAIGLWAVLTKRVRLFFKLPFLKGAGIFLLIVAPWYILAERANPGFLWYFFVHENLLRFLVKDYGDRYGSGHVYVYGTIWFFLLSGFLPGSFLILSKAFRSKAKQVFSSERKSALLFALSWTVSPAIIFTFSRQISPSYVLPGLPGLALLCGPILQEVLAEGTREGLYRRLQYGMKGVLGLLAALLVVGIFFSAGLKIFFLSALLIAALSAAYFWLDARRGEKDDLSVCVSLLALALLFTGATLNISPYIEGRSSTRSVVRYVENVTPPIATLGFLGTSPHSAYFYSRRPSEHLGVVRVPTTELANAQVPLLAARAKDVAQVPADMLSHFSEVARVGKWIVFSKLADTPVSRPGETPQNPEISAPSGN